jgi:transcriptional regulator with XRE-family HTH domain
MNEAWPKALAKLKEISEHCASLGIKVDPSYLSRLRSGDRPAPEDLVLVEAIASACYRDPDALIFLARFERHPEEALKDSFKAAYGAISLLSRSCDKLHETVNLAYAAALKRDWDEVDIALHLYVDDPETDKAIELANEYERDLSRRLWLLMSASDNDTSGANQGKQEPAESEPVKPPLPLDMKTLRETAISDLAALTGVPAQVLDNMVSVLEAARKA